MDEKTPDPKHEDGAKRSYEPPELRVLGTVGELTRANEPSSQDTPQV